MRWILVAALLCAVLLDVKAKLCPNKKSTCPDWATCCKMARGGIYGCCPYTNAQCCNDGIHCCPVGTKCDEKNQRCAPVADSSLYFSWMTPIYSEETIAEATQSYSLPKKEPEVNVKSSIVAPTNGTKCSDGSFCPDKNTCCVLDSGRFGCCPLVNAVCCVDKLHCCPDGMECNLEDMTCVTKNHRGYEIPSMELKTPINRITMAVRSEGNVKSSIVAPTNGTKCSDGSFCPDKNTCCVLDSGRFGCCPLVNAVCCVDKLHCCPDGMECNLEDMTCVTKNHRGYEIQSRELRVPINRITMAVRSEGNVKSSIVAPTNGTKCSDGSFCPDKNTCCVLDSGRFGCCPLVNAVCCVDKLHCCPDGMECNLEDMTCVTKNHRGYEIPSMELKTPINRITMAVRSEGNVKSSIVAPTNGTKCSDGSFCPDKNTCCVLDSGRFGCCPLVNAVCCVDKLHCCPDGMECNLEDMTCVTKNHRGYEIQSRELKTPINRITMAVRSEGNVKSSIVAPTNGTKCSDGSFCPDKNTCCVLDSGRFGCCPLVNAVCCVDKLHCCPDGMECNLEDMTCVTKKKNFQRFEIQTPQVRRPAYKIEVKDSRISGSLLNETKCPNGQICSDTSTCCKISSEYYGCCPLVDANCCSDLITCCPSGYECDVDGGACHLKTFQVNRDQQLPSTKTHLHKIAVKDFDSSLGDKVVCPSGYPCPPRASCCLMPSGHYGCCPYPKATCCEDQLHCCPENYKCNLDNNTCLKERVLGDDPFPSVKEIPLYNIEKEEFESSLLNETKCPNGQICSDTSTCCKISSEYYGCCPLVDANCCSDLITCCPSGYECDVDGGACHLKTFQVNRDQQLPSTKTHLHKIAVKDFDSSLGDKVVCPSGYPCPPRASCCLMPSGHYGCCPYPKATCCEDQLHCCPENYKCNLDNNTCLKERVLGDDPFPSVKEIPLYNIEKEEFEAPHRSVSCPVLNICSLTGQKCCISGTSQYCCPNGFTCSEGKSVCRMERDFDRSQIAARSSLGRSEVDFSINYCPDGYRCADESTCCPSTAGGYGCCPLPEATCCDDKIHCCAKGYVCNGLRCERKPFLSLTEHPVFTHWMTLY